MQKTMSDSFTLGCNLGAEWQSETNHPNWIYTFTTGYKVSNKTGVYAELYGFLQSNQLADNRCDGGMTYLINNNVIIDLSGGFGLTKSSPNYYGSLGFSFRI